MKASNREIIKHIKKILDGTFTETERCGRRNWKKISSSKNYSSKFESDQTYDIILNIVSLDMLMGFGRREGTGTLLYLMN